MDLFKCYCMPALSSLLFTCLIFVIAYGVYRLIVFGLKRLFSGKGYIPVKRPFFVLMLEIATLISLHLFELQVRYEILIRHILVVLVLATLGWLLIAILRGFYHNFQNKVSHEDTQAHRSLLTQLLFAYRFSVFFICVLTIAAILMTFPAIRALGMGVLGSAGIAGIALGIAARPILLNLMSGMQIALTHALKIGDVIFVEGECMRIESIHLTHIVTSTSDLRRFIFPISYFIDHHFQNWDTEDPELIASILLYCDYAVPMESLRTKAFELLTTQPLWNGKLWKVEMTDCTTQAVEVRVSMSANHASDAFALRCWMREQLIDFLQKHYPNALPCLRERIN